MGLVLATLGLGANLLLRPAPREESWGERNERIDRTAARSRRAYHAGELELAEELLAGLAAEAPEDESFAFGLGCVRARLGDGDGALAALARAVDHGYDDPVELGSDPDLESLRGDPGFEALVERARLLERQGFGPIAPPSGIAGVRTVEGFPAGGLRYRLLAGPGAGAGSPHRLVIWLHGGGDPGIDLAEPLAPALAAKGYALLVPTQKRWALWSERDAARLLDRTLPELDALPEVDAARPVLLGFSSGGQEALELWRASPARFGGIAVIAAYPLDPAGYLTGSWRARAPPQDPAAAKVPLLAFVGGADGGAEVWREAVRGWPAAGITPELVIVPGREHEWLIGPAELERFLAWLPQRPPGEPGSAPP